MDLIPYIVITTILATICAWKCMRDAHQFEIEREKPP